MAKRETSLATTLLKGAVAGALGVWALDRVTWFMWNRQDPASLEREEAARPLGLDPAHLVAHRVRRVFHEDAEPEQPSAGGMAVHYSLGVVPGAIYSALRRRSGGASVFTGALVGLALFLAQDVALNRLLRLSGNTTDYPWQAYARGLVGHTVFGATTDLALQALDHLPPADRRGTQAPSGAYENQPRG